MSYNIQYWPADMDRWTRFSAPKGGPGKWLEKEGLVYQAFSWFLNRRPKDNLPPQQIGILWEHLDEEGRFQVALGWFYEHPDDWGRYCIQGGCPPDVAREWED